MEVRARAIRLSRRVAVMVCPQDDEPQRGLHQTDGMVRGHGHHSSRTRSSRPATVNAAAIKEAIVTNAIRCCFAIGPQ